MCRPNTTNATLTPTATTRTFQFRSVRRTAVAAAPLGPSCSTSPAPLPGRPLPLCYDVIYLNVDMWGVGTNPFGHRKQGIWWGCTLHSDGVCPVDCHCWDTSIAIIKLSLALGVPANINEPVGYNDEDSYNETALFAAATSLNHSAAAYLLARGADVHEEGLIDAVVAVGFNRSHKRRSDTRFVETLLTLADAGVPTTHSPIWTFHSRPRGREESLLDRLFDLANSGQLEKQRVKKVYWNVFCDCLGAELDRLGSRRYSIHYSKTPGLEWLGDREQHSQLREGTHECRHQVTN